VTDTDDDGQTTTT